MTTEPLSPSALDTGLNAVPVDRHAKGPRCLEVRQLWGGNLLDVRTFAADEEVTVGTESGLRWSVLGRPMGWVDARWTTALRASPPLLSTVGMTWRSDFVTEDAAIEGGTSYTCVAVEGGRHVLRLDPTWPALVDLGGERVDVEALLASGRAHRQDGRVHIPIDDALAVAFKVGALTLVVSRSPVAARLRPHTPGDPAVLVAGIAIAAVSALTALAVARAPADLQDAIVGPDGAPHTMVFAPSAPKPVVAAVNTAPAAGKAAPKGDAGRAGTPRGDEPEARGGGRSVEAAGVLAAWDAAAAAIGAGLSSDLKSGVGGLIADRGTQLGYNGLGYRGGGLGGGGTADEVGGLDPRGRPDRHGVGDPNGFGRKVPGAVSPHGQEATVLGDALSRSLIDEVIKRKLAQIRFCYQRQLQHEPDLAGSLVVSFTIAGDGSVSRAGIKRDGLGSGEVAACVVDRFEQMQFPRPNGGGLVMVTYPFAFAAN